MPRNDIQKQGRILMLPVDCIEPSPYQARTAFDEPEIAALAVSILQNGLLHRSCTANPTDFNPHSPCGERQEADRFYFYRRDISIHTPHAGSDLFRKSS